MVTKFFRQESQILIGKFLNNRIKLPELNLVNSKYWNLLYPLPVGKATLKQMSSSAKMYTFFKKCVKKEMPLKKNQQLENGQIYEELSNLASSFGI